MFFATVIVALLIITGCNHEGSPMQDGFSWVIDEQLAGLPIPGSGESLDADLAFLASQEIDLLVSLTDEAIDREELAKYQIESLHVPERPIPAVQ